MMPPEGRERWEGLPLDVLSNLPDNVIDVILLHLPFKEAVKTSVLSKQWRYHWCRLRKLTLDQSLWETEEDLRDPTVKFIRIIYQILTLHEGPITKFTLNIDSLTSCPKIDNFIYFLSRNGIQQLVLRLPGGSNMYKLPSSLFTCSQLRHLALKNCLMHPPSGFQGFKWLICLELCAVTISSESLESLVSHCPLLEQLVLNISGICKMIEINAPMLRSFNFTGHISCICLKNVPVLVKVSLTGDDYKEAEDLDFAKVFESCSALEHLLLDLSGIMIFDKEYEVPTRLPFDLNSVKRFYLEGATLSNSYNFSFGLCLIRSFPYLEYLKIEVFSFGGSEESLDLKHLSGVAFDHLKVVKLNQFRGRTSEMQLIKHLLANSPVLERMRIYRWFLDQGPLSTTLFAELSNFLRASPKAKVVYKTFSGSRGLRS